MKDGINLFSEDIESEINAIKSEEDEIKKIETKYKNALSNHKSNNSKRIQLLRRIRLEKIKEIERETEKNNLKLEKLYEERDAILLNYCARKGHNYIQVVSYTFSHGKKTRHSYLKCTVCRMEKEYKQWITYYKPKDYKQKIPKEVYDDITLAVNRRTYKMVLEEIEKFEEYRNYLQFLRNEICKLFGHDGKGQYVVSDGSGFAGSTDDIYAYTCNCCLYMIPGSRYVYSRQHAMYKIFNDENYLISSTNLEFSLPTFENYKESLEQKRLRRKKKLN